MRLRCLILRNTHNDPVKKSEIHFTVELDKDSVPEKIFWQATDNPNEGLSDTNAVAIGIWDNYHKGTLKLDLWTNNMDVYDMKRFCIEVISGVADTLQGATGDVRMADQIESLCKELSGQLKKEISLSKKNP